MLASHVNMSWFLYHDMTQIIFIQCTSISYLCKLFISYGFFFNESLLQRSWSPVVRTILYGYNNHKINDIHFFVKTTVPAIIDSLTFVIILVSARNFFHSCQLNGNLLRNENVSANLKILQIHI